MTAGHEFRLVTVLGQHLRGASTMLGPVILKGNRNHDVYLRTRLLSTPDRRSFGESWRIHPVRPVATGTAMTTN